MDNYLSLKAIPDRELLKPLSDGEMGGWGDREVGGEKPLIKYVYLPKIFIIARMGSMGKMMKIRFWGIPSCMNKSGLSSHTSHTNHTSPSSPTFF